ncbi:DUF6880 family protein [Primorskyibacter sp. 2E107]|uniref:DUF6880 family protein n=1 Tax=Primorskyibacter sp. 2E107 TaxID=3403458 RepID=UPI003AF96027
MQVAYGHGAKYHVKLAVLARETNAMRPGTMADHAAYLAKLKKTHTRKSGFWARVGDTDAKTPQTSGVRSPVWNKDDG